MKPNRLLTGAVLFGMALSAYAAPLVRYFELTTEPERQAAFDAVGVENLSTSVEKEPGTLAMYALHQTDAPNVNYVFEIYQDDDAYRIHSRSPQFEKFVETAKTAVVGRKVFETEPHFLYEKSEPLRITDNRPKVNFAEVRVKPEFNAQFKAVVLDEMQQSMAKEAGVLAMYAVTLKERPNEWRFFEIYADEQAYRIHRETPHFRHYLRRTAEMTLDKKVISLQGGTLMNKGGLRFIRH
ncbi:hypothetical protein CBG46_08455 [Actinobacillus succinogenes]|uniref:Antibiotic biosynthesis monooxygenase n=1 Tax=Actinobacillus succinogenes (strain ATCC 55618 / DSM 22257 / CCUG 43843 / 130Z) TaxID=339671 RepID=A6VPJ3_ACTSZ|nr:antibiotic biosynthesis monooxygenase [Actinobacillus succinogenes]ABR74890.1 Antibiotic biosynthesis monooxygenase [Actinobacillus succinogenes 130Z]PHI40700.1 hypothetical protein CBG46_08455 [Actinobacillus succinogenes]